MNKIFLFILIALPIVFYNCSTPSGEKMPVPFGLLCELLREPEKAVITDRVPEFGWIFPLEGKTQESYQILVASSLDLLQEGNADFWDSKRTHSSKSIDVSYAGKILKSNSSYFWKVKVWDEDNRMSSYSEVQQFHTGKFSGRELEWPGQSHFIELGQNNWVSENRQTAVFHSLEPHFYQQKDKNNFFADFGKAAFGTLELEIMTNIKNSVVQVYLGERQNPNLSVNKDPGISNIGYTKVDLPLVAGKHHYTIKIPSHTFRSPYTQKMAPFHPEVLPFRFVEVMGSQADFSISNVSQLALWYPFDDDASYFWSDQENLNQIWDLCKYTLKATPFLGVYADGNRERMPYEADAYIQQLGHYAVDREFSVARYSADFLIHHASWPTEWQIQTVFMAWEDYMHTGNTEFIAINYELLKAKTLMDLSRKDGLISSKSEKANQEFFNSLHYTGSKFRDCIDWPEGERDGYVITDYNTVINSFHYRSLILMAKIAAALNNPQDQKVFENRAKLIRKSLMDVFFDQKRGIFVDGEGSDHAALHANMFPLAFGLVPDENLPSVVAYIKSKGMACSVYGAQYLLEGLYNAGASDYALSLMISNRKRSWMNMIKVGSTMTTEAWDEYYKPNLTWNHAWGSAPANIISRKLMGIEALEPGFQKFRISPQPSGLEKMFIRKPSIRGEISYSLIVNNQEWQMKGLIPGNSEAEVWLPAAFTRVMVNGELQEEINKISFAGEKRNVFKLKSGKFSLSAN